MRVTARRIVLLALTMVAVGLLLNSSPPNVESADPRDRWIMVAKSDDDFDNLRAEAIRLGARVLNEMRETRTLVVAGSPDFKTRVKTSPFVEGIAKDATLQLINPSQQRELFHSNKFGERVRIDLHKPFAKKRINPDPAFSLPGLMWNVLRIRAPEAWKHSTGSPAIKVAVADTGLDFTHSELKTQIDRVVDLTVNENPPLCKTLYGYSDQDMAAIYGGPATTDWNGHGSWIGGNIAAALDEQGINGIAPKIKLVALKIGQWCGSAYISTMLDAFRYAANNRIPIVSISYTAFLDRTDPDQDLLYKQIVEMVNYARRRGTLIVAAAGNEHVRIDANGQVTSHGGLTIPGNPLIDYFGMWQVPGGVPGVVMVSSTNNVVNAASASCTPETANTPNATCKPASDQHQPFGVGKQNQLAYYSNYGPRIDIAAPGGARKFNLPNADRGGTPGYPVTTADGFNAWEDFSTTSNWALAMPCYYNLGEGFPENQCYSIIQGTSTAVPHVSATLALIASRNVFARHFPWIMTMVLKVGAQRLRDNATPGLSATDTSPGDLSGIPCLTGYCHLGGAPIPSREAFGAGLVDARIIHDIDDVPDWKEWERKKLEENPEENPPSNFLFLPFVGP